MRLTLLTRSATLAILSIALLLAFAVRTSAQNAGAQNAPESANTVDQQFVTAAIKGGDKELDQAQAQLNGSSNPSVKLFAQTIIRDHTTANSQLAAIAKNLNLQYPQSHIETTTSSDAMGTPAPAAAKPNPSRMSDQTYMQQEVAAHQQTIALFENEVKNGGSQQLRTAAAQLLPILKAHLAMAEQYMNTGQVTPETPPAPNAPPHQ